MAAPPGTRRRAVVRALRRLAGLKAPPGGESSPPPRAVGDASTLRAINCVLWWMERPLLRPRKRPRPGAAETARWVLTTLLHRNDMRRRHPQALRDGPEGGFCRELCALLGEQS